jgi:hypothetical protein
MNQGENTGSNAREGSLEVLDQVVDQHWDDPAGDDVHWLTSLGLADRGSQEQALGLRRVHRELAELRIAPSADFVDRVMRQIALEPGFAAGTARRRATSGSWLVAAVILLAVLSATLLLAGGTRFGEGPLATLGDLAMTSLAAGAGLLGATWTGIGTIASSWLQTSPVTFAVAAACFVAAPVLLLLRRRQRTARVRSR